MTSKKVLPIFGDFHQLSLKFFFDFVFLLHCPRLMSSFTNFLVSRNLAIGLDHRTAPNPKKFHILEESKNFIFKKKNNFLKPFSLIIYFSLHFRLYFFRFRFCSVFSLNVIFWYDMCSNLFLTWVYAFLFIFPFLIHLPLSFSLTYSF